MRWGGKCCPDSVCYLLDAFHSRFVCWYIEESVMHSALLRSPMHLIVNADQVLLTSPYSDRATLMSIPQCIAPLVLHRNNRIVWCDSWTVNDRFTLLDRKTTQACLLFARWTLNGHFFGFDTFSHAFLILKIHMIPGLLICLILGICMYSYDVGKSGVRFINYTCLLNSSMD